VRSRDVLVLVLDESEFFASNSEGGEGYAVTDDDQINAAMPRLLGFVLCVSTPWPTDNATARYFESNHGRPTGALAALGHSMFMRPSPELAEDIERERLRDPDNAAREYECRSVGRGGSKLLDPVMVDECVVAGRSLIIERPAGSTLGCGGDLGLERDSSAICVVSNTKGLYELLEFLELRPAPRAPLVPGRVISDFALVMGRHGARIIAMDAHYRQSAIEHLSPLGLRFRDAPGGIDGKYETHMRLRAAVHGGRLRLPPSPRLVAQLKAITVQPLPGGQTRITSPRRAGQGGHGDVASALVLAVWACLDTGAFANALPSFNRPTAVRSGFGHQQPAFDSAGIIDTYPSKAFPTPGESPPGHQPVTTSAPRSLAIRPRFRW
jgi:hypothetical protein